MASLCAILPIASSAQPAQSPKPIVSDADVALLGGALLDLQVRDAAMALGLTVMADEARLLFAELARRGYSQADLEKIASGNMLRVLKAVEAYAASQKGQPPIETPVAE